MPEDESASKGSTEIPAVAAAIHVTATSGLLVYKCYWTAKQTPASLHQYAYSVSETGQSIGWISNRPWREDIVLKQMRQHKCRTPPKDPHRSDQSSTTSFIYGKVQVYVKLPFSCFSPSVEAWLVRKNWTQRMKYRSFVANDMTSHNNKRYTHYFISASLCSLCNITERRETFS